MVQQQPAVRIYSEAVDRIFGHIYKSTVTPSEHEYSHWDASVL